MDRTEYAYLLSQIRRRVDAKLAPSKEMLISLLYVYRCIEAGIQCNADAVAGHVPQPSVATQTTEEATPSASASQAVASPTTSPVAPRRSASPLSDATPRHTANRGRTRQTRRAVESDSEEQSRGSREGELSDEGQRLQKDHDVLPLFPLVRNVVGHVDVISSSTAPILPVPVPPISPTVPQPVSTTASSPTRLSTRSSPVRPTLGVVASAATTTSSDRPRRSDSASHVSRDEIDSSRRFLNADTGGTRGRQSSSLDGSVPVSKRRKK